MDFSRFVFLSALLTHVSSSPIGAGDIRRDGLSSPHPTGQPAWVSHSDSSSRPVQTSEPWTPTSTVIDVSHDDDPHPPQIDATRASTGEDDGAMKPIMRRGDIHDRADSVFVTLSLGGPPTDRVSLFPLQPGCTSTVPRTGNPCPWDGTETIYPSTIMRQTSVDCHGCSYVENQYYFCPNFHIIATKSVSTASTYWSTVCSPSPTLTRAQEASVATATSGAGIGQILAPLPSPAITAAPKATEALEARQDNFAAACPTTYFIQPEKSAGKTFTTYSRYTTTTVLVKCGGCPSLVTQTALVGYGPPADFTKTTTLPLGTKTTYASSRRPKQMDKDTASWGPRVPPSGPRSHGRKRMREDGSPMSLPRRPLPPQSSRFAISPISPSPTASWASRDDLNNINPNASPPLSPAEGPSPPVGRIGCHAITRPRTPPIDGSPEPNVTSFALGEVKKEEETCKDSVFSLSLDLPPLFRAALERTQEELLHLDKCAGACSNDVDPDLLRQTIQGVRAQLGEMAIANCRLWTDFNKQGVYLERENDELKTQLNEVFVRGKELMDENERLKTELGQAVGLKTQLQDDVKKLATKLDQAIDQKMQLQDEKKRCEAELKALGSRKWMQDEKQLKNELSQAIIHKKGLRDEIKRLRTELSQAIEQKKEAQEKITRLEAEHDQTNRLRKDLQDEITRVKTELGQLRTEHSQAVVEKNDLRAKQARHEVELSEAIKQKEQLQGRIDVLSGDIGKLVNEKTDLVQQIDISKGGTKSLVVEKNRLKQRVDKLEAENRKAKASLKEAEAGKAKSEASLETIGREKTQLEASLETLGEEKRKLEDNIESLRAERKQMGTSLIELLARAEAAESHKAEVEAAMKMLETQAEAVEAQKQELQTTSQNMEASYAELRTRVETAESENRELKTALQAKVDEIEALRPWPEPVEANPANPDPGDYPPPSPWRGIKAEAPETDPKSERGLLSAPFANPLLTEAASKCSPLEPTQPATASLALEAPSSRELRRLKVGTPAFLRRALEINLFPGPAGAPGTHDEMVAQYIANFGAAVSDPVAVTSSPLTDFWQIEESWMSPAAAPVPLRSGLEVLFAQLCFLIPSLASSVDSPAWWITIQMIRLLMWSDHALCPEAGAAFLETLASAQPVGTGPAFTVRNALAAIMICELCRRLESVFPSVPRRKWAIGSILGPEAEAAAHSMSIGKLGLALCSPARTDTWLVKEQLTRSCGGEFCLVASTHQEPADDRDIALLHCGDKDSFLIIDFGERSLRFADCRFANLRQNRDNPRKFDLVLAGPGGEVLFEVQAVAKDAIAFWARYVMMDD
ncbi:hypothetical protein QBC47DRAFT_356919 [Echria macrotheca]|uniref:Uncharacterized protein n=1 Tax=Echria macrotheca TaxID=438768 RepID=A0AAJ0BKS4_9PEZI|nr:hypothetical protein QBC47DRAFT_356919 [Echria macrotheca]